MNISLKIYIQKVGNDIGWNVIKIYFNKCANSPILAFTMMMWQMSYAMCSTCFKPKLLHDQPSEIESINTLVNSMVWKKQNQLFGGAQRERKGGAQFIKRVQHRCYCCNTHIAPFLLIVYNPPFCTPKQCTPNNNP